MKFTKKIFALILTVSMCLTACVAITACKNENTNEPTNTGHTHVFETEYSKNETHHYYACQDQTCTEVSNKEEHNLIENVCDKCGYKKTPEETQEPNPNPGFSKYQVTEEEFSDALSFNNVLNISIKTKQPNSTNPNVFTNCTYKYDENKVELIDDSEYLDPSLKVPNTIFVVEETQIIEYYYVELTSGEDFLYKGWRKESLSLTDESANFTINYYQMLVASFNQLNFADFTYEEPYYTQEVTEDGETYTVTLKFEDKKLVSMRTDSEISGVDFYVQYEFFNYGTTTVEVPTEYMDLGMVNPSSEWASYFEFGDNLTVTTTENYKYIYPTEMNSSVTTVLKISGNKWLEDMEGLITCYYDGENGYIRNDYLGETEFTLDDRYSHAKTLSAYSEFARYESKFTETSEGVFEADAIYNINFNSGEIANIINVKIIITNGKIQRLEYTTQLATAELVCDVTTTVTFTNYGLTIVE